MNLDKYKGEKTYREIYKEIYKLNNNELLPYAIRNGFLPLIKYIQDKGVDLDDTDIDSNYDAIIEAAQNGKLEVIEYIINKVEYVYENHTVQQTILNVATENGWLNIVKYFVKRGFNKKDILIYAAEKGQLKIVNYLIENGTNIHSINEASLIGAASQGHLDVVKYLIENGANIHARNDEAYKRGTQKVKKYLEKYM